jgi:hypothetical protein
MDELDPPRRTSNLVSLIAWLSVCLLAAAWGRTLDVHWQGIWARVGAFGLAAAVGLKGLEKARHGHEKLVHDLTSRTNRDGRLARLNQRSAATGVIEAAIRRLTKHFVSERQGRAKSPARDISLPELSGCPLEVIPVKDDRDAIDIGSAHSIAGSLRTLSSRVVNFEHDETFADHVVILAFTLGKRDQLCFVVNVIWTGKVNDRFVSSGAVMAVGVPAEQVSKTVLVTSSQRS